MMAVVPFLAQAQRKANFILCVPLLSLLL